MTVSYDFMLTFLLIFIKIILIFNFSTIIISINNKNNNIYVFISNLFLDL